MCVCVCMYEQVMYVCVCMYEQVMYVCECVCMSRWWSR
jgi:hypothetical protein